MRHDRVSDRDVILLPERGIFLSATASEVIQLCDGTRTLDAVVAEVHRRHPETSRVIIGADVETLLAELSSRGVIEDAS